MAQSSRFVVAAHILALLASSEDEAQTSESIADSVNANPVVVRRILGLLAKSRLVAPQEGAGGGYRLAKPPRDINLRAVYTAVEFTRLFALHPQDPNPSCPVGNSIQAALSPSLDAAEDAMMRSLAKTSIAALVGRLRSTPM